MKSVYFNELVMNCKNGYYFQEDGRKLGIFRRIIDFFKGKGPADHFLAMETRLKEEGAVREFSNLSCQDQLIIIDRIHQLQKKWLLPSNWCEERVVNLFDHEQFQESIEEILHSNFEKQNTEAFFHDVQILRKYLETHSESGEKILNRINIFLEKSVFKEKLEISELKKEKLLILGGLFQVVNEGLPQLKDPHLKLELKLKFANLPCPDRRDRFSFLFLTEKDQLDVIIQSLTEKETTLVNKCTDILSKKDPSKNCSVNLYKLCILSSPLQKENQEKLRKIIASHKVSEEEDISTLVEQLRRTAKARQFFQSQLEYNENQVFIPRWYHSTSNLRIEPILSSKELQVRERNHKGVWVSTQLEALFGDHVFAFNNQIMSESLVKNKIRYQGIFDASIRRWRGAQEALPLQKAGILAIPSRMGKCAQKVDKQKAVELLKQNELSHIVTCSREQLLFMQNEIKLMLGVPMLNDAWWGPGEVYSVHQKKMHDQFASYNPSIYEEARKKPLREGIGMLLESAVLPIYKTPMPQISTYKSALGKFRVRNGELTNGAYKNRMKDIENKKRPARGHHGTMHAARVTLWTEIFRSVYADIGEVVDNPLLLAIAGAFHDAARESEGVDYWDGESAELLKTFLECIQIHPEEASLYILAVRDKDPPGKKFTSIIQKIIHDADCVDIIRVIGWGGFNPKYLACYEQVKNKGIPIDNLIKEMGDFIDYTESFDMRRDFEHQGTNFYADLINIILSNSDRFPELFKILSKSNTI